MLINPAFVFIFIWSLSLFLYTLHYSNVFLILSDKTINYILLSEASVFFAWLFFVFWTGRLHLNPSRNKNLIQFTSKSEEKIKFIFLFWVFFSIVELLYFRDLPIFTVFGFGSISYLDYGIPTLHGLLNAIILSLSMYVLYTYLRIEKRIFLFYYFLLLIVPVLSMSRGTLVSMLVESLFVVLVFKGIRFKLFLKLAGILVGVVFLFGWLGELRTEGLGDKVYEVFNISDNYPGWLPKSFIWVYMYLTSSLNNLENIIYSYPLLNFEPYKALFGLLPSFVRNLLDQPVQVDLVTSAFNVSSFMPNYLSAFGVYGSILFYFLASLVSMYIFYKYMETRSLALGFSLVIILHSVALSVFSDFFAVQVYFFQFFLQYFVFTRIKF